MVVELGRLVTAELALIVERTNAAALALAISAT